MESVQSGLGWGEDFDFNLGGAAGRDSAFGELGSPSLENHHVPVLVEPVVADIDGIVAGGFPQSVRSILNSGPKRKPAGDCYQRVDGLDRSFIHNRVPGQAGERATESWPEG
jgi:hypothetical protein